MKFGNPDVLGGHFHGCTTGGQQSPARGERPGPKSWLDCAQSLFNLGFIIYLSLGLSVLTWELGSEYLNALSML